MAYAPPHTPANNSNMPWRLEEDAILIYYISRNAPAAAIKVLIGLRCHTVRSSRDIFDKVDAILNCESLASGS